MSKFVPSDYDFVFSHIRGTDTMDMINTAMSWMRYWLTWSHMIHQKGCVVFDIDHTLIDGEGKVIKSVFQLYELCINLNFDVCIVTARGENKVNRNKTKELLIKSGIDKYKLLYMMPIEIYNSFENISAYKKNAREDIELQLDTKIIGNIGDQWSDHYQFPTSIMHISDKPNDECVICFLPSQSYPCVKLPMYVKKNNNKKVKKDNTDLDAQFAYI